MKKNRKLKTSNRVDTGDYFLDVNPFKDSLNMDELKRIRRRLAKRANSRMVALDKHPDLYSPTYDNQVTSFLETESYRAGYGRAKRFSEILNTKQKINDIRKEVVFLQNVLRTKNFSIGGARDYTKKMQSIFDEKGSGRNMNTFTFNREVGSFMSDQSYRMLASVLGSEFVQDFIVRAVEKGNSLETIKQKFDEYLEKNMIPDIDEVYRDFNMEFIDI